MILPKSFYQQDTVSLAKKLLGCYLVSDLANGKCLGKIVETESYMHNDPAAHTYNGTTKRNQVLFGPPGFAYIYFIYGMHYCVNVSSSQEGIGEAVLIRALEPIKGIELMKQRRQVSNLISLTNGPGKLTQALGIDLNLNGVDLTQNGALYILSSDSEYKPFEIITTNRIGIAKAQDLLLRFYIKNNPFVSKP